MNNTFKIIVLAGAFVSFILGVEQQQGKRFCSFLYPLVTLALAQLSLQPSCICGLVPMLWMSDLN